MPFDPTLPTELTAADAAQMRAQFNGLFDLIQTIPVGPAGPAGVTGAVVDGVTTEPAGTSADATVALTAGTLRFSFSIPRGDVGATGTTGADGGIGPVGPQGPPISSYVVDGTNTLLASMPASVAVSFDGTSVHFIFGIPAGPQGVAGPAGPSDLSGTSSNSNAVAQLSGPLADPDAEALRLKVNELIGALRR